MGLTELLQGLRLLAGAVIGLGQFIVDPEVFRLPAGGGEEVGNGQVEASLPAEETAVVIVG